MSLFKFQVEIREREKRNLPESNQSQTLVSMADPNHCSSSSSPPTGLTLDSDEISTLINTLLHNSSLPPSSFASPQNSHHHQHQPPTECASAAYDQSAGAIDSSSGLNFSFPSDCYAPGETERSASPFSGPIASSADGIGDFDCDSEREQLASEAALNSERVRGSSKRSRMAEFHNLSEKKRRQKINEKMKALQKLIPNSNKTDKASLLDDAIDYLKQLQLQVQMLAMRNGSSLHPFYIEGLQTGQPTFAGINYSDEGFPSSSRGIGSLYTTQGISTTVYNPDQYVNSEPKTFMPPTSSHCRPFNFTMSSKEIGHDSNLPQLKLDVNGCGDESSSGVSS